MNSTSKSLQHKAVLTAVFALLCAVAGLHAQTPAQKPENPPADTQQPQAPTKANPFPEDTSKVPVIPTTSAPAAPDAGSMAPPVLPPEGTDPARSPDDPMPNTSSSEGSSSSNSPNLARILEPPPDTRSDKKNAPAPEHVETAKEDENVGNYYLSNHNWRGALSRFQSALVLDPYNPDVYWGLAESQRHLGQFAEAKTNYLKVMEYDPDSKHAKEAKKLLKEPDLANATALPLKP